VDIRRYPLVGLIKIARLQGAGSFTSARDNPIKGPQPILGKFATLAARPLGAMFAIGFLSRVSESRGYG
jgi:hypothetical protein